MDTMNQGHIEDSLPAYSLGALDPEERLQVETHLAVCAACRDRAFEYDEVAHALPALVPQRDPPKTLKRRVIGSVPGEQGRQYTRRTLVAALSLAAAPVLVLSVVLLVLVFQLRSQVNAVRSENRELGEVVRAQRAISYLAASPNTQITLLRGTQDPQAHAMLMRPSRSQSAVLVAIGLEPLPQGRTYQLWLIHNSERQSGGVFTVDVEGYGQMTFQSPMPFTEIQQLGVTIEPASGSALPGGDKVLSGEMP